MLKIYVKHSVCTYIILYIRLRGNQRREKKPKKDKRGIPTYYNNNNIIYYINRLLCISTITKYNCHIVRPSDFQAAVNGLLIVSEMSLTYREIGWILYIRPTPEKRSIVARRRQDTFNRTLINRSRDHSVYDDRFFHYIPRVRLGYMYLFLRQLP